mgnify:FL=1
MMLSEYIILILAGALWRFDIDFRQFNKKVGLELSESKQGSGFQDAITPPKLNWFSYFVYFLLIASFITAFFDRGGWKTALICLGILIATMVITGVIFGSNQPNRKPLFEKFYFRVLFNSMVNRHADYLKNNDKLRAEAMENLVTKFKKIYKKEISQLIK